MRSMYIACAVLVGCGGVAPRVESAGEEAAETPEPMLSAGLEPGRELNLEALLVVPAAERVGARVPGCVIPAAPTTGNAPNPVGADLGTAHPIWLHTVSPNASYVLACQARIDTDGDGDVAVGFGQHGEPRGDAATLYLMSELNTSGVVVDDLIAVDAVGRRVVYRQAFEIRALDTLEQRDEVLFRGAPVESDGSATLVSRGGALSHDGARLAYLRMNSGAEQVVVRDMDNGTERVVPMESRVWRLDISKSGQWLSVLVVREDTDGDGEITLPLEQTTLSRSPCRGRAASYSTYGFRGDETERELVRVCDGARFNEPVVARTRTGALIERSGEGLVWIHSDGGETGLVPPACSHPTVLEIDEEARAVVVDCGYVGSYRVKMRYAPGSARRLGFSTHRGHVTHHSQSAERDQADRPRMLHTRHVSRPVITDRRDGSVEVVLDTTNFVAEHLGSAVAFSAVVADQIVGPAVIVIPDGPEGAVVLGTLPRVPLTTLPSGWSLLGNGSTLVAGPGPLRWVRPTPRLAR